MKKAQSSGYIFIYILTAILVSVIFIYGYRTIGNFKENTEKLSEIKFENDFNKKINEVFYDRGTIKNKEFILHQKYTRICILNTNDPITDIKYEGSYINPRIELDIGSESISTVYLIEDIPTKTFTTDEKVDVSVEGDPDEDVLCIEPDGGKISLRFSGKGDHALIASNS
tara:strand:+ start:3504 stop:4013 length:510 start_codon:yes stop_codon:yes gene_type:complete